MASFKAKITVLQELFAKKTTEGPLAPPAGRGLKKSTLLSVGILPETNVFSCCLLSLYYVFITKQGASVSNTFGGRILMKSNNFEPLRT